MLYQLSHVRAQAPAVQPKARSETIAERTDGVQTHLGSCQSTRPASEIIQPGYPDRVTLTSPTSVRQLAVWSNGRRCERPEEATVPVTDHGLVVGDGVFEALKATPAGAFAVRRHLDRLSRSAAAMGLPDPDHELIREGIASALDGWPLSEAKVRITFTGGEGPLGSGAPYGPPNLIVAVEPREPTPVTTPVVTAPWRRNENGALTGVKSTSYAGNVRGLAYAASCGASEAIFLNTAGDVCEGTGTNTFFVFGGLIVTPPLSAGPLAGITRELLLEWHDIVERNVTPEEAETADEVFITSSLREIQGVERWDDRILSASRPVTEQLAALFRQRSIDQLDP
jgi:branched-chain amino acid aminotransferase